VVYLPHVRDEAHPFELLSDEPLHEGFVAQGAGAPDHPPKELDLALPILLYPLDHRTSRRVHAKTSSETFLQETPLSASGLP
jgi:hypothetical protein